MTGQRTGEMEPGHDHRAGVICHLPEELSAQPTGKGVNSLALKLNYIVSKLLSYFCGKTQFCFVLKLKGLFVLYFFTKSLLLYLNQFRQKKS